MTGGAVIMKITFTTVYGRWGNMRTWREKWRYQDNTNSESLKLRAGKPPIKNRRKSLSSLLNEAYRASVGRNK
jgi:hypothetical protein